MTQSNHLINEWVTNIINTTSKNVSDKLYTTLTCELRLTFIKTNECCICDSIGTSKSLYTDNWNGRHALKGWYYCEKCKPYVMFAKNMKEITANELFYYTYKYLKYKPIAFWRKSRTLAIDSYLLRDGFIDSHDYLDVISIHYGGRVLFHISWSQGGEMVSKHITLSNVIYFNRYLFGYSWTDMECIKRCRVTQEKKWQDKWISKLEYEYQIADNWNIIKWHLRKYGIPFKCLNIILDYWGELYVFVSA